MTEFDTYTLAPAEALLRYAPSAGRNACVLEKWSHLPDELRKRLAPGKVVSELSSSTILNYRIGGERLVVPLSDARAGHLRDEIEGLVASTSAAVEECRTALRRRGVDATMDTTLAPAVFASTALRRMQRADVEAQLQLLQVLCTSFEYAITGHPSPLAVALGEPLLIVRWGVGATEQLVTGRRIQPPARPEVVAPEQPTEVKLHDTKPAESPPPPTAPPLSAPPLPPAPTQPTSPKPPQPSVAPVHPASTVRIVIDRDPTILVTDTDWDELSVDLIADPPEREVEIRKEQHPPFAWFSCLLGAIVAAALLALLVFAISWLSRGDRAPIAPATVAPASVAPATVASASVAPASVAPASVASAPVAPAPVAPAPVAPAPVAPAPVAPGVTPPTAAPEWKQALLEKVRDAIVRVVVPVTSIDENTGTGFFFTDTGLVVTNHHVIEYAIQNGGTVYVILDRKPEIKFRAKILKTLPERDLALLQVYDDNGERFRPSKFLVTGTAKVADDVMALGYPGVLVSETGEVNSLTATFGEVNCVTDTPARTVLEHSARINPGNSGGPLINKKGETVGINTFAVVGSILLPVPFSVHSKHLKELLP